MDKQPLKVAAIVAVIVVALAGLAFGMKTVAKSEEYKPSPGSEGGGAAHWGEGGGSPGSAPGMPSSAPGMPGGPPSGRVPGSAR